MTFCIKSKGDRLGQVHSDKMVFETSRRGWSSRAVVQRRPRFSKLGLKELSDYYSNWIAVGAARQGADRPNKRVSLTEYLLKRESSTTALSLAKQGPKGDCQRKTQLETNSNSG
jgi:hypothetical protein